MTGSAPISFNAGAESSDRVSANTAWRFALRRRTSGRPIAPLAPAIRTRIALPCSARFAATRELFDLQSFLQQVADEHGDACSSPYFVDARPINDDASRYANDGNIGVRRTDSRNMQVQSKSRC
jgi:hypothetical protein